MNLAQAVKARHLALLAASLLLCAALGLEWERKLVYTPAGGDLLRAQSSEDEAAGLDAGQLERHAQGGAGRHGAAGRPRRPQDRTPFS